MTIFCYLKKKKLYIYIFALYLRDRSHLFGIMFKNLHYIMVYKNWFYFEAFIRNVISHIFFFFFFFFNSVLFKIRHLQL